MCDDKPIVIFRVHFVPWLWWAMTLVFIVTDGTLNFVNACAKDGMVDGCIHWVLVIVFCWWIVWLSCFIYCSCCSLFVSNWRLI